MKEVTVTGVVAPPEAEVVTVMGPLVPPRMGVPVTVEGAVTVVAPPPKTVVGLATVVCVIAVPRLELTGTGVLIVDLRRTSAHSSCQQYKK